MARRQVDLKKVFVPADTIAFIVIAIGLFIALFLDEMAVRLIGVCIAVLGGVALFMMVSPRLTDLSVSRPPRPTESPSFRSETRKDALSTSQVFDSQAYRDTFGADEVSGDAPIDERQIELFPDLIEEAERREITEKITEKITGRITERITDRITPEASTSTSSPTSSPTSSQTSSPTSSETGIELGEPGSSVRIIGTKTRSKSASAEPALLIHNRATVRAAELRAEAREIQLSDDVIIRPKSTVTSDAAASSEQRVTDHALNEESEQAVIPSATRNEGSVISSEARNEQPTEVASSEQRVTAHALNEESEEAVIPSETRNEATVIPSIARNEEAVIPSETRNEEESEASHEPPTVKRRKSEISVSAFMTDVDEEMESSEEPRKEFDYLLNRVLMVIRSATTARTAAFFWYNRDKQQLVLEAKITDAGEDFTDHRKLPIGQDVVSQIAKEGRPQILTDISPAAELDLLPYYRYKAGTLSFVGVPVYYKGNVVGVLCADSKEEDAYTDVTVGFFGHFTKLISGLVSSYTSKFDLQHSARLLEATQQFRASLAEGSMSTTDILASLFDAVVRQMQVSTIGVCMYDRTKQAWTIADAQSVVASFNELVGSPIDLNNSVVGESIKNGEAVSMPANMEGIRVSASEHELLSGQFIAIPLRSAQRTHGALFIENHEGTMSAQDVAIAESLGDQAGQEIENLRTVERLESGAMLDADTGALNTDGFIMRVREEFARSTDYSISLSVCLIRIDRARATEGSDGSVQRSLLKHVLDKVRQQVREYDVVARYDSDVVAVALVGYASQEAQFWTENLRRDVASSAISVDGKRLTATISVGVAEADPRENWQSVLEHATTALEISSRQQNKVTLFS